MFNSALVNDVVYKFNRYGDSSLGYAGIESRLAHENAGLYDTVLTGDEYRKMFGRQQKSLS